MKFFLSICLIVLCEAGFACSGFPRSFCYTHFLRPNDAVIKGNIIVAGSHSIQVKVLEVLSGTESRPVITVWDGTDFDCNGNISMKVSGIGSVADTIVAILPVIQTVQNAWDVVGDYARPYWLFYEPVLKIRNDTLRGIINGSMYTTSPYWYLGKMNYADFKAYWVQHQDDCSMLVGLAEQEKQKEPFIRQYENHVHIYIPDGGNHTVRLVSLQGRILEEHEISGEFIFDLEHYASGMYLICVLNPEGRQYRQKIIR